MKITVRHDPLNLPAKRLIQVTSGQAARRYLDKFCTTKDSRGYTLRYIPDNNTRTIELGDRKLYNVEMAIRALKDAKIYIRTLPWASNAILKKITAKF